MSTAAGSDILGRSSTSERALPFGILGRLGRVVSMAVACFPRPRNQQYQRKQSSGPRAGVHSVSFCCTPPIPVAASRSWNHGREGGVIRTTGRCRSGQAKASRLGQLSAIALLVGSGPGAPGVRGQLTACHWGSSPVWWPGIHSCRSNTERLDLSQASYRVMITTAARTAASVGQHSLRPV